MNDAVAAVGEFSAGKAPARMGERPRSRCDLSPGRKRREVRGGERPYPPCPELEETRRERGHSAANLAAYLHEYASDYMLRAAEEPSGSMPDGASRMLALPEPNM